MEIMLLADFILPAFGINNHGTYFFLSPDMAWKYSPKAHSILEYMLDINKM